MMKLSKLLCAVTASLAMLVAAAPAARADGNVIRVGTDATFPPMEFVKDGKRTGFDIELIEALAKTMGKKVQWIDIDFKGLIPGLISNRFDIGLGHLHDRRAPQGRQFQRSLLSWRPGRAGAS
jgi:polar amino acid transport system substrate-binding protein